MARADRDQQGSSQTGRASDSGGGLGGTHSINAGHINPITGQPASPQEMTATKPAQDAAASRASLDILNNYMEHPGSVSMSVQGPSAKLATVSAGLNVLGKSNAVGTTAQDTSTGNTAQALAVSAPPVAVVYIPPTSTPIIGGNGSNPNGSLDINDLLQQLYNASKHATGTNPTVIDQAGNFMTDGQLSATVKEGMGALMILAGLGAVAYLIYKRAH